MNAPQTMLNMIVGYWTSQAIFVAAKLNLADLLQKGPRSADDLARETGTHAPSLYRLLRGLASNGIFSEDAEGRFSLTELARCLVDTPGSQKAAALMMGDEHYHCWGDLLYSIQTGKTAFEKTYRAPVFDYLSKHPDKAKIFDAAMSGIHGAETQVMLDAYDFAGITTLVDIGGGNGSVLRATLTKLPQLRGILYDLPGVVERAKGPIAQEGLADRCQVIGGSFFESVPPGSDAYMMRHIIHDWTDEQSLTILKNCRKAMKAGAKLLLVESVIPPGNEPSFAKMLDLNMLVLPGGKERTEAEYRKLYAAAGFELKRIVPTKMEISVIEGEARG